MDGQQPGALDKAAEAMIQVVKAEALGADAVRVMGEKLAAIEAELTDWEQIAVNTAFEGIEQGSTRISELVKAIKGSASKGCGFDSLENQLSFCFSYEMSALWTSQDS